MGLFSKTDAQKRGDSESDRLLSDAHFNSIISRVNAQKAGKKGPADFTFKQNDLQDYINLANEQDIKMRKVEGATSTYGANADFQKLFENINLSSKEGNTLSIGDMNYDMGGTQKLFGNVASKLSNDFLTQMQTIFENRKTEILNRYQRPGAQAQTGV